MDIVQIIRKYQGDMTQQQYADALGVGQSTLSMLYSGQRKPGMEVIRALVRAFPHAVKEVVDAILAGPADGIPEDDPTSPFYRQIEQVA